MAGVTASEVERFFQDSRGNGGQNPECAPDLSTFHIGYTETVP